MISVVIVKAEADGDFSVDLWLMSCRVMGRAVENAIMDDILRRLAAMGAKRLVGLYIPTRKNVPVSTLYEKLGFSILPVGGDERRYEYCIDGKPFPASTPYIRNSSGPTGIVGHGSV